MELPEKFSKREKKNKIFGKKTCKNCRRVSEATASDKTSGRKKSWRNEPEKFNEEKLVKFLKRFLKKRWRTS